MFSCPAVECNHKAGLAYTILCNTFGLRFVSHTQSCKCAWQVGRAGRFGTKGLAITFVASEDDSKVLNQVCLATELLHAAMHYVTVLFTTLTSCAGWPPVYLIFTTFINAGAGEV